ncbi:asparagine synthase (glutamine-hydrolyzing) [Thalassospira alkalitolerans]|uniref:asparagine synthase (glutamine-hydrolyzing) n=1 Tax=Thalassospira alkalitolerans TaxID=1293890 RepID=UPI003AA95AF7
MCGLAGATAIEDRDRVVASTGALAHRGPDGEGIWCDPDDGITFGVRRLITTDPGVTAGQPLISQDGRFVLAFNGYIAGHRRWIADLRARGVELRSDSDAELFLSLLATTIHENGDPATVLWGISGQYAFALWDCHERMLWLGRDPVGIKPLYFVEYSGGQLAFASEISALRKIVPDRPDPDIFQNYLAHLFVPAPATGFAAIRQVQPGELICWQGGKMDRRMICAVGSSLASPQGCDELAINDPVVALYRAVRQSVADAMDADRDVGALMSGGMDSGGIAAIACDIARGRGQKPPPGFVMQFDGAAMDETPRARQLADYLGMELHIVPAPQTGDEILAHLQEALTGFGAPFGNPSVVLMQALGRGVSRHVPICLAGDGGDELFGGYPRYQAARLFQLWHHVPAFARRMVAKHLGAHLPRGASRFVYGATADDDPAFKYWNNRCAVPELGAALQIPEWDPNGGAYGGKYGDPYGDLPGQMMAFDQRMTLPGNQLAMSDRCGMAHGVEYRVPLLARDVIDIARRIAPKMHLRGGGKSVWRAAIEPMLPDGYLRASKVGFNPPAAMWLAKVGPLLWGSGLQICDGLFADLPVTGTRRAAYWQAAISGKAPDMALCLWALMVWRLWQGQVGDASAAAKDIKAGIF